MALNDFPIWLNAAVFAVAGFVVWGAGTRLAVLVDGIARRSGIGHAFLGILLLGGGITSLPEVATVASASMSETRRWRSTISSEAPRSTSSFSPSRMPFSVATP
jgi:Ca2+/Na+ antiporter